MVQRDKKRAFKNSHRLMIMLPATTSDAGKSILQTLLLSLDEQQEMGSES